MPRDSAPCEVLHVLWEGTGGGAERHVADLAIGMRGRGVAAGVLYLCRDGGAGTALARAGAPWASLHLRSGADPRGPARVAAAVRGMDPRIVHDHVSAPWLRALLPRDGRTVIATEHGHLLRPEYARAGPRLWIERLGARRTDLTLAPSEAIAAAVERVHRVPRERIRVIPHGIRPPAPDAGARFRVRRELGLDEGAILVLFVGRLDRAKGALDLLDAFGRIAPRAAGIVLAMAGRGPLAPEIARRVEAEGSRGRVRLLGFRTDVDRLLAAADLFVLPARHEAFGIVLLEAMAAGVPIVATRTGGIPEIVEDGRTGVLAPPADPAALAEALLRLAGDPARRQAYARSGRERWAERFTLDRCVEETLEAYRWVESSRRDRRAAPAR